MSSSTPKWVVLAHLLRPQGRKGELLAELFTDFPERFDGGCRVLLAAPNFVGNKAEAQEIEVMSSWLPVGKNEGRVVLQLAGVDTISAAERIAGQDVIVPFEERLPLDDESSYISDLVGCTVYDGGMVVGVVEDIQFPSTADGARRLDEAAPLLSVMSPDGNEVLIPFAKVFLVLVDVESQRIEMNLPPGLVELNRPTDGSLDQKR